jgi:cyclic pyranopterin phosphate synthase
MDVGRTNGWRLDEVVPAEAIVERIDAEMPLEPVAPRYTGEVADRWRYLDGGGEIGVISSVTQPFCKTCTRARLTADGNLYTCLFGFHATDVRGVMREGADDRALRQCIEAVWIGRADRYSELRSDATAELPRVEMSRIGG